jgi:hypothetical protein
MGLERQFGVRQASERPGKKRVEMVAHVAIEHNSQGKITERLAVTQGMQHDGQRSRREKNKADKAANSSIDQDGSSEAKPLRHDVIRSPS